MFKGIENQGYEGCATEKPAALLVLSFRKLTLQFPVINLKGKRVEMWK